MDKARRRELIRDHKERRARAGFYVVRCAGRAWVGASPNLDAQQNSLWFSLRNGGHRNRDMQSAWGAHGPEGFAFEILEVLEDEEMTPLGRADALKSGLARWRESLCADAVFG
ncbi:GIY-YIG nuclease family protein [Phenylobacterium sp.]|uniref:GIY-YIG nuclease family protein n=1 Tax=Phenylobacterium sp. TaxID=1871053 RepID=UPI0035C7FE22